ncbi:hypothetical protein ACN42_g8682 [Penicillium freii]|uniref:Uncharacterized protein n=1 Tax=Penicillium freii TaxID=48697 RepID=A0A117NLY9_PENFR|nr:hypothetical protein ACN42_g8682 [Penicillium freii]
MHWLQHKDAYGPVSSITVLGQTIVILNDAKPAMELLAKPLFNILLEAKSSLCFRNVSTPSCPDLDIELTH